MAPSDSSPILFITRSWHGTGGMQRLSKDLARELGKVYGQRLTVIHPAKPGIVSLIVFAFRTVGIGIRLKGQKPFIHLGDASLLPLGSFLKKITDGRLSLTACGLDVVWPPRWYQMMITRLFPSADRVVCISEATRDEVLKRGVPIEKAMVIPCGVNVPDVQASTHDPRLLVTVGRLVPRKGVAWFVEQALPSLIQEEPTLRYAIVGDGPDEARIRGLIQKYRLEKNVELKTHVTDENRDTLLRTAGIFVMPVIPHTGDMEGFGIVCIEASVRGTPVAAARIGGVQDAVLENETGRFFEAGDAKDCIRCIRALMNTPLDPARVSSSTAARYGWPVIIQRYADVFR